MKWTDGLKKQLKELAFEKKSNKEIAEIMDIPLKEVHAGRSRVRPNPAVHRVVILPVCRKLDDGMSPGRLVAIAEWKEAANK